MIMGDICTRRCPFCDVAHGKPEPLDPDEPRQLAEAIHEMALSYVVVTSVDRDDLRDGGAAHFGACISETRKQSPDTKIELSGAMRTEMSVHSPIMASSIELSMTS